MIFGPQRISFPEATFKDLNTSQWLSAKKYFKICPDTSTYKDQIFVYFFYQLVQCTFCELIYRTSKKSLHPFVELNFCDDFQICHQKFCLVLVVEQHLLIFVIWNGEYWLKKTLFQENIPISDVFNLAKPWIWFLVQFSNSAFTTFLVKLIWSSFLISAA